MTINGVDTTHYNLTGATLKAHGKAFVCRYVQNFPTGTLDKEIRHSELVEKTAAGVRVVANWEWAAAPSNSRSVGQRDANLWLAKRAALGIPDWAPCYYSIDTGAQAGSYNAYAQGWLDELPREQLGVYGDGALFRQLKADGFVKYAWQSMSRSFPGNHLVGQPDIWDHRGADIIQTTATSLNGLSCDLDTATVDDYGGFLLGEDDPNMALTQDDINKIVAGVTNSDAFADLAWRVYAMANMADVYNAGSMKGTPVAFTKALKALPTTAAPAAAVDYAVLAKAVNDDAAKRLAN